MAEQLPFDPRIDQLPDDSNEARHSRFLRRMIMGHSAELRRAGQSDTITPQQVHEIGGTSDQEDA